jgi:hypothetical protein
VRQAGHQVRIGLARQVPGPPEVIQSPGQILITSTEEGATRLQRRLIDKEPGIGDMQVIVR